MVTQQDKAAQMETLPVIALRGMVIFPQTVIHFDAGREKSVAALNVAMESDRRLFVVAQKNAMTESPAAEDLYSVGTVVTIKQVMQLPDGVFRLLVEGVSRAFAVGFFDREDVQTAEVCPMPEKRDENTNEAVANARIVKKLFTRLSGLRGEVSTELRQAVAGEKNPGALCDAAATGLVTQLEMKQKLLEIKG